SAYTLSLHDALPIYAAIAAEASARGAALVDFHALLADIARNGFTYNGVRYTTAYVTGGLFSLDGVHPTDLGYGVIANRMIDAVRSEEHTSELQSQSN